MPRPAQAARTVSTNAGASQPRPPRTALICAGLLIASAVVACLAVSGKSATFDEPMHAMAAAAISEYGDYRLNPEDPPLWQRWASLFAPSLRIDRTERRWSTTLRDDRARWTLVQQTLYETRGVDADAYLFRLRLPLAVLGVLLGAVVALWSWRLAGGVAAVAGAALVALDPNLLAHTVAIKNDVAITLVGVALAYATWRAGQRLTWGRAAAVVALAAIAPVVKFSGPLLFIVLVLTLALRVMLPATWDVFGRMLGRAGKALTAMGLILAAAVGGYVLLWATYSFRYAPSPDGAQWDFTNLLEQISLNELAAERHSLAVTSADVAGRPQTAFVRTVLFLRDHKLVPQTWAYGNLFTYRSSRVRKTYLLGHVDFLGSRAYFPVAFLVKTPLATQAALLGAAAVGGTVWLRRRRTTAPSSANGIRAWDVACLSIPPIVLGAAIVQANLNIGIRHLLPVYPYLFIAIACAVGWAWRAGGRNGRVVVAGLAAALAIETATAYPSYIAFFNAAAGGPRGGLKYLGDSNLDWGQDLPLLAEWQRRHPDRPLYLCYFGQALPSYYRINYRPLPGTDGQIQLPPDTPFQLPREACVMAISATQLQGIYQSEPLRRVYAPLRDQSPLEVVGGTIYLFEFEPN